MDSSSVNLLSLCSGVGMLDEAVALGCASLGWRARTVGYCERDAYAAACLVERMEEQSVEPAPVWAGDMRDFDGTPFRGVVDIVAAGLPCQPYSAAGKQRGLDDHRSYGDGDGPIPHALRIIAECRPSLVFFENVSPWVRGGWFRPVGEELCRLGYTLEQPLFVTAESVGASHRRERVFVLAHARGSFENSGPARVRTRDDSVGEPSGGVFAPSPNADWREIPESLWPAIKPGFRVLVNGVAVVLDESRADQLRCGGNGVVAVQGAVAFVELMRRVKKPKKVKHG